ncbi:MAG TPA: phenylalanine--tRNA ligase subunit beta [Flavisolibacter sp.]|nr:phenylalanine--tRNA ligase subunit beta [Flavisolibacter sp.]
MTISYNWLSEYLPEKIDPARLSTILTSVGLEVEKMEEFEEIKGGLQGLVIGQVLETEKHPNADKLKLTKVDIGNGGPLQIVCGAPNVAAGQKVIVAPEGATIYPVKGDPLTMKIAKIRGVESQGMICAEDEIGLGNSHEGIMVLPKDVKVGITAQEYFAPYTDIIYEIGLTPNRMDAMSHWGVARDVCAYLTYHDKKEIRPLLPVITFKVDKESLFIDVSIVDKEACRRYSGVCIANVTVAASPKWLQEKLKSIGLRPINNIVDITNFIQHETGQPLHAFDYDEITSRKIVVKTLAEGTKFVTLDEKERKLSSEDLMICNGDTPICIAGVFGGLNSGVTEKTKNIFIESAWFDPVFIRKTSFRHGLRTDAATRFEKGIDISNTVTIAKRAAILIKEIAKGTIASDIIDVYPYPEQKKEVSIKYHYLKKVSGKNYAPDSIKNILVSLGFTIVRETVDALTVDVPYHKPDISIPADLVEEILRIDGLDNIPIPSSISITPSVEKDFKPELLKERVSNILTGLGCSEILTNSITNSAFFTEEQLNTSVRLLNNLSVELDILRPSMLHTALEVISFNLNRKNTDLKLFEFGKTYSAEGVGSYTEQNHLCLYVTGRIKDKSWNEKAELTDIYFIKGICNALLAVFGIKNAEFEKYEDSMLEHSLQVTFNNQQILYVGKVQQQLASKFDIKQAVFFADFNWDVLMDLSGNRVQYKEIPKYPAVERDLAIIVPKTMNYKEIKNVIVNLKLNKLQEIRLFDVFESEKLGDGKKSMAVNFTFLDVEKTLTDKEIDTWMNKIMDSITKNLNAEIRK